MSDEAPYTDLELVRDITFADPHGMTHAVGESGTEDPKALLWPLLWGERRLLLRWAIAGLIIAFVSSLFVSDRYTSTVRLMPPDSQNSTGLGMLSLLSGGSSSTALALGSNLLSIRPTGALFVGILSSRTLQDDIITQFDLRKAY